MQVNKPLREELTLDNIMTEFATDAKARKFLEKRLWPTGPVCPRCQTADQSRIAKDKGKTAREGLYRCNDCRRTFTVTVGTIFEDSHIPLRKWIVGMFLMCSSKKGMSSLQFKRILGLGSYRTALFMTHRIRHAITETDFASKLTGTVEVDETYVGGKAKGKTFWNNKTPVVSLVQRDGTKRSIAIKRVTAAGLMEAIVEHVEPGTVVMTDQSPLYTRIVPKFTRRFTSHNKGEYARKERDGSVTHTNNAESSFSLLKRGVYGTFHSLSPQHLGKYCGEFDFRWNLRHVSDGQRMLSAVSKTKGKRLTYKAIKGD